MCSAFTLPCGRGLLLESGRMTPCISYSARATWHPKQHCLRFFYLFKQCFLFLWCPSTASRIGRMGFWILLKNHLQNQSHDPPSVHTLGSRTCSLCRFLLSSVFSLSLKLCWPFCNTVSLRLSLTPVPVIGLLHIVTSDLHKTALRYRADYSPHVNRFK